MRVLVTGASGFIGSHIVTALRAAGHEVIAAVRNPDRAGRFASGTAVRCDLARDTHIEDWLPRLEGIDAVVNAAGILRESGRQKFRTVHVDAPRALFEACLRAGVRKVIQISALGNPQDGEFIRSKHDADDFLATLELDWVILRPSVVYSPAGSYGGTSLLRALAALPGFLFLPGDGQQRLQPIVAEDLGRATARLVETDGGNRRILEATGPTVVTFEEYLGSLRRWLGLGTARVMRVPLALIRPFAALGEVFGRGPLGLTMFRMLQRGNVATPGAAAVFAAAVGFPPHGLRETLEAAPSHVQDRWHARLYPLAPLLRSTLALLWIGSGLAGFLHPLEASVALLGAAGVPAAPAAFLVYGASGVDMVLGALVMTRFVRIAVVLMLVSVVAYTLFIGIALPTFWLEPFGALLKNLPLIPALLMLLVLADRR